MDAGECHLHNQFLLFVLNLKYRLLQNHRMFKLEKTLEIVSFTLLYYMEAYYPQLTGLSRQEYWSGLPFPSPGDLPDPRMELTNLHWQAKFFTTKPSEIGRAHV